MRPTKSRIIGCMPRCRRFQPVEAEKETASHTGEDVVTIALDMLEAMRLVDAEGMSQESAARCMDISAPTLCRILAQGRRLVAQALSSGKTITLDGGNIMYGDQMHGRHGQGCCHGHGAGQGRHGNGPMQGNAEAPAQEKGACCGRHAGRGQGQCQGKGPGQGGGRGQCRRQAAAPEQEGAE